jgi:hypothetical protein
VADTPDVIRTIMVAMNPVIEYPGSSMIQRARRLRTIVETRGWEQAEKQYPEVGRMRAELAAGLAAELERHAEAIDYPRYREGTTTGHVTSVDLQRPRPAWRLAVRAIVRSVRSAPEATTVVVAIASLIGLAIGASS